MNENRSVTSVDVANLAGVSQVTVSRTLSGKTSVSPKTKERVMEAVEKLGYRPNSAARAARTGKTGNIGLLLSTVPGRSRLQSNFIRSIHHELNHENLHLTLSIMDKEELSDETKFPKLLKDVLADGLICNYTHGIPPVVLNLIDRYQVPAVWVNTPMTYDCVLPDDRAAGKMATEHLISLGHRNIAYMGFAQSSHHSEQDRTTGYREAMLEAGLPPRVQMMTTDRLIEKMRLTHDNRVGLCRSFLEAPDRPTAVVTYSMTVTEPLYVAAVGMGLGIPDDLSVVTIGDDLSNPFGFPFTTVLLSSEDLGRAAVRMVLRKLVKPGVKQTPVTIPPVLNIAASSQKVSL